MPIVLQRSGHGRVFQHVSVSGRECYGKTRRVAPYIERHTLGSHHPGNHVTCREPGPDVCRHGSSVAECGDGLLGRYDELHGPLRVGPGRAQAGGKQLLGAEECSFSSE